MRINRTRERLARGETVVGCSLQVYRSSEIPRALAAAGFDYVFIDMEHGSFNLETVRAEEHTSELQSLRHIVCRLLLWKRGHRCCQQSEALTTKQNKPTDDWIALL